MRELTVQEVEGVSGGGVYTILEFGMAAIGGLAAAGPLGVSAAVGVAAITGAFAVGYGIGLAINSVLP